jgi:hypothetical protein
VNVIPKRSTIDNFRVRLRRYVIEDDPVQTRRLQMVRGSDSGFLASLQVSDQGDEKQNALRQ